MPGTPRCGSLRGHWLQHAHQRFRSRDAFGVVRKNVAAASASRTTTGETTTREHAQSAWLDYRAEQPTGRDDEREATTAEKGRAPTIQPDDDLAK